jgi:hypothetical protein
MVGAGTAHYDRFEASSLVDLHIRYAYDLRPVLITPGEMADEIFQCIDVQIGKLFCLCRPNTF